MNATLKRIALFKPKQDNTRNNTAVSAAGIQYAFVWINQIASDSLYDDLCAWREMGAVVKTTAHNLPTPTPSRPKSERLEDEINDSLSDVPLCRGGSTEKMLIERLVVSCASLVRRWRLLC